MHNLVVCCDGTWNTPDELRSGAPAPTNVAKLALTVRCGEGTEQKLFYQRGVGTGAGDRVAGGAIGWGLSRNIRDCYRFLAREYEPGDAIFLFGFSRGAYTARSLAGLIHNCGLLTPEHADKVDAAFALYRDRTSVTRPRALASRLFRKTYAHDSDAIHFIGVWDTVGALGLPFAVPGWREMWGFHDTQLGPHVANAYHAISIDEQRPPFAPTPWTSAGPDQTVEQVWFSGVHTDVGGGSHDAGLSDIALLWMVAEATRQRGETPGLQLDLDALTIGAADGALQPVAPSISAPLGHSRRGAYRLLPAYHRLVKASGDDPGQSFASSAIARHKDPALQYDPPGWDAYRARLHDRVTTVQQTAATPTAADQPG